MGVAGRPHAEGSGEEAVGLGIARGGGEQAGQRPVVVGHRGGPAPAVPAALEHPQQLDDGGAGHVEQALDAGSVLAPGTAAGLPPQASAPAQPPMGRLSVEMVCSRRASGRRSAPTPGRWGTAMRPATATSGATRSAAR